MPLISSLGVMNAINFGLASSKKSYDYIIVSMSSSPYLSGIQFSDSDGFGTVISNPATLPTNGLTSCILNKENTAILCTDNSANSVLAYAWSKGFGTKYANPSTAISSCTSAIFNSLSNLIFVKGSGIYAYDWSNSTGFGAKYTNPTTQPPGGTSGDVASGGNFSANTGYVVTGDFNNPYLWGYSFSGGFNTKFANPSTGVFGYLSDVKIFGNDLVCARGGTPYLHAYASNFTGFGTKYADPPITTGAYYLATTPTLNAIFYSYSVTYSLGAIKWTPSGGWGTQYSNLDSTYGTSNRLAVNSKGNVVVMSKSTTPYLSAVKWDYINGFGIKYNNPTSTIIASPNTLTFQR